MSCSQQNPEVQSFIRWLWVLTLVPEEQLNDYFEWVKERTPYEEDEDDDEQANGYNEAISMFMTYFESNFVGITQNTRNGTRRKPKFEFKLWSCYESVLSGTDLTTNVAESWNSVNKLSTVAKPNMWGLIRMFQKEESMARAMY